jgi:hypothetical protein
MSKIVWFLICQNISVRKNVSRDFPVHLTNQLGFAEFFTTSQFTDLAAKTVTTYEKKSAMTVPCMQLQLSKNSQLPTPHRKANLLR